MSDRVIRDEILDSERYLSLTSDTARLLFIHFVLVADDLGNSEAGDLFVRRRLLATTTPEKAISALISELADADLIRAYEVDGKRFIHIPRFRQRLRYTNSKFPRPPEAIECQSIKDMMYKKSDLGQTQDGPKTAEVKRSEVKRSKTSRDSPPVGGELVSLPKPANQEPVGVWDLGVAVLHEQGLTTAAARAFIGSLLKSWDDAVVEDAFRAATGKADIKQYVLAVLKTKPKKAGADLILKALREEHGSGVRKTAEGYRYPERGMAWDATGKAAYCS
jgi:hypothetical protein